MINNYNELKIEDLKKELVSLKEEYSTIKKNILKGKEKNVRKSLSIKRNIARIQTALTQKSIQEVK